MAKRVPAETWIVVLPWGSNSEWCSPGLEGRSGVLPPPAPAGTTQWAPSPVNKPSLSPVSEQNAPTPYPSRRRPTNSIIIISRVPFDSSGPTSPVSPAPRPAPPVLVVVCAATGGPRLTWHGCADNSCHDHCCTKCRRPSSTMVSCADFLLKLQSSYTRTFPVIKTIYNKNTCIKYYDYIHS